MKLPKPMFDHAVSYPISSMQWKEEFNQVVHHYGLCIVIDDIEKHYIIVTDIFKNFLDCYNLKDPKDKLEPDF